MAGNRAIPPGLTRSTRFRPAVAFVVAALLAVGIWAVRAGADGKGSLTVAPVVADTSVPSVLAGGRPRVEPAAILSPDGKWPTGVATNTKSVADAYADFRGRPNDVVVLFTGRDTWGSITSPWIGESEARFAHTNATWVISVPMFPDPPAANRGDDAIAAWSKENLPKCAAGEYDTYFRQFGTWLVSQGAARATSFVRIGWEPNGQWQAWQASDPVSWVQCWRHEALALRSTAPKARLDWTINAHTQLAYIGGDPLTLLYPGDDVVDVVGIDTYDQYPPSIDGKAFEAQCNMPSPEPGMCTVIRFAQMHNKLFSVPEWGLVGRGTRADRNYQAGGDNAIYITMMAQKFQQYAYMLAYEAYFPDADTENNVASALTDPELNPQGAKEYARLWR